MLAHVLCVLFVLFALFPRALEERNHCHVFCFFPIDLSIIETRACIPYLFFPTNAKTKGEIRCHE